MNESASPEINKSITSESVGSEINKITSPEQIHHETASAITTNLETAGHPTTVAEIKNDPAFRPSPDLKKLGVKPSGGMSFQDMSRVIIEDLDEKEGGAHRVVTGKASDALRVKIGKKQEPIQEAGVGNKVVSFVNRILGRAA